MFSAVAHNCVPDKTVCSLGSVQAAAAQVYFCFNLHKSEEVTIGNQVLPQLIFSPIEIKYFSMNRGDFTEDRKQSLLSLLFLRV